MPKFSAVFEGAVFDVDLAIGGHAIGLTRGGDKWSGSREIAVAGDSVRIEMKFVAPSFTDWKLTVKSGTRKILEESDTSDVPAVSFNRVVALGPGVTP